jgi:hypothetical protein
MSAATIIFPHQLLKANPAVAGQLPVIFKAHPAFAHYSSKGESYDYMFPGVSGCFSYFSAYWKKYRQY